MAEPVSAYDTKGNFLTQLQGSGLYVAAHKATRGYGQASSAYTAMEIAGFNADECHDMWRKWISLFP